MSRSHGEHVWLILNIKNAHSAGHILGSSVGATQKLSLPFAIQMKYDVI